MRRTARLAAAALLASTAVVGCGHAEKTTIRRETVTTMPPPAVVERRTTVETVPPPVVEQHTTTVREHSYDTDD